MANLPKYLNIFRAIVEAGPAALTLLERLAEVLKAGGQTPAQPALSLHETQIDAHLVAAHTWAAQLAEGTESRPGRGV